MAAKRRSTKRVNVHAQPPPEPLFPASDLKELRKEQRSRERGIDGSAHEGLVPVEYVMRV